MAITDAWLNPFAGGSISVIGYHAELESFPHDIYSYYLSTIRDDDIRNVRLLWRWLQGMQYMWEYIYGQILSLPTLYSPDDCPEELLQYLRHNIGITDDLDYLWQELSVNEQRRLIKYFVYFLTLRATAYGIEKMVENMTGDEVEIYDYFDFRTILGGEAESDWEVELGREDLESDFWLLSEVDIPTGVIPDHVATQTVGGYPCYEFRIDTLIETTLATELPVPPFVRVGYRPNRRSVVVPIFIDPSSGYYRARTPANEFFEQEAPYSKDENEFRVGFDPDPYVFDIRIVDDGTVDRDLMKAIVRFERPMSERIYIRYYSMIEKFENLNLWTEVAGTSTLDATATTVTLTDTVDSIIQTDVDGAEDWTDYSVAVKVQNADVSKYFELRFYYQDSDNYLYLRVTPGVPPTLPAGTWRLGKVVATVDTALATGNLDWFDVDTDYFWRVVCVESGSNLLIQVMQDENLLSSDTYAKPWAISKGEIQLVSEANGEVTISYLDVHPVPMDSNYVGL